jgi:flagellar biosynthesis chaperone FliJ
MSRERRRRADKLLDARQRGIDLAEAELGSLARATLEANGRAESARTSWRARMEWHRAAVCSSDDLAREHAYLATLEKQATLLADAAREAKAREEIARLKVCNAKTEHKKVETWRDRLVEAVRLEDTRIERLQSDELAARVSRKT